MYLCRKVIPLLSLAVAYGQNHQVSKLSNSALDIRDNCGSNTAWQSTIDAWLNAGTDNQLSSWWQDRSSRPHGTFANEIGRSYGDHMTGFECGIGAYSTCEAAGCSAYEKNGDPIWSYLALLSVVHLNQFFNSIFVGISNGQAGYLASTEDLSRFFPWKDPEFLLGDASFWIVAIVSAVFAIPGALEKAGAKAVAAATSAGAFVGAGVQHVTDSFEPSVIASEMPKTEGMARLKLFAAQVGTASRESIEAWANATMHGDKDTSGATILDYLRGGSFTGAGLPTNSEIEQFYKKQMVSRTINSQWRKEKVFATFFKTDNPDDIWGPNVTRWYSPEAGGVYYLYRYIEDGVLRGHLDKPWGLDYLNGTNYGITGRDITKASARAYEAGAFNYTQEIAQKRIVESLSSNGTLTPFKDGAAWEGTWTIPVCDMGKNNWNSQYGHGKSKYGMLPCCCGPDCSLTSNFTKAANLHGFQTLLHGCREQLKGGPLAFESINYGFGWKKSLPLFWATLTTGQKAGLALGFIFGPWVLVAFCIVCCCR